MTVKIKMSSKNVAKSDIPLWPLKLHYFLFGAGNGPILPFLSIIGKQLGISGSAIGFTLGMVQVCGLIIKPVFGALMDKYPSRKRSMLQIMILIALVAMNALKSSSPIITTEQNLNVTRCQPKLRVEVPGTPHPCLIHKLQTLYSSEEKCTLICNSQVLKSTFDAPASEIEHDRLFLTFIAEKCNPGDKCRVDCENEEFNRVFNKASEHSDSNFSTSNFWLIFYAWVLGSTAIGGVGTFNEAIATQAVQNHVSGETFGHQRLWASVGWGLSALIVGYLVDQASESKLLFDYSPAFTVMSVLFIIDLFVIRKMPKTSSQTASHNPKQDILKVLSDLKVMIFLMYATAVGILFGSLTQEFILLEDLGHRSDCNGAQAMKFLQGLVLAINTAAETPMFLFSGRIIKKLGSIRVMNSVLFIFALRMFFYACMITPWQVIMIEWIHGPIVGLFYPILTSTAYEISPPGLSTTTIAIALFTEGIGIAIGSWMAGSLQQFVGSSMTFALFGYFASAVFVIHYITQKMLHQT